MSSSFRIIRIVCGAQHASRHGVGGGGDTGGHADVARSIVLDEAAVAATEVDGHDIRERATTSAIRKVYGAVEKWGINPVP